LDIGIGTDLLTYELYKKEATIYGIDFSEKMIKEAHKKMPNATFFKHNFTKELPEKIQSKKFDFNNTTLF
jgi:2-polyprenyl-3-methyl-5-hydroxy-6-metoxy-1,4-benzoquinol methylase